MDMVSEYGFPPEDKALEELKQVVPGSVRCTSTAIAVNCSDGEQLTG